METPYYLYDLQLLQKTISAAQSAANKHDFKIHYAIKANDNPTIIKTILQFGLGVDCINQYEINRALKLNCSTKDILLAGVGKSDEDIKSALLSNINYLNSESIEELKVINDHAKILDKPVNITLRVNPNVEANTHKHIRTGLYENKFGIHLSQLQSAIDYIQQSKYLNLVGLHFHIGSQITNLSDFKKLCNSINKIWKDFNMDNYNLSVINLGGGLGIDYDNPKNNIPDFESYFKVFNNNLKIDKSVKRHFELGRSLVGQCGKIITKVLYVKEGINKDFIILDAGMTELMRPALYQSQHYIENISADNKDNLKTYDIVGPICESTDKFIENYELPITRRNDLIAIHSCGAYGESMLLKYNLRPKIKSYFNL